MHSSHWPLFGFGCLAFLLVCTVIAVAAFLVFRSGEKGTTKLGAPAGCLVGCALLLLALLGALGAGVLILAQAPAEFVRHGPVRSFEFELEPPVATPGAPGLDAPPGLPDGARRARLTLDVRGGAEWQQVSEKVTAWLRERTEGEIALRVTNVMTKDGARTRLEFALGLDEEDLRELRKDLALAWPGLGLPKKLRVDIKEPSDD